MAKRYKRVDAEDYEPKNYDSILRDMLGDNYIGMTNIGGVLTEIRTKSDLSQAELAQIKKVTEGDFTVTTE